MRKRIVVEQRQLLRTRRLAELYAFLPGRMAKAALLHHLLVGIGGVVDDEVSLVDQRQNVLVEFALDMLACR